jgi:hypothetical protein
VTLNLPGATGWQRAARPYNGATGYVNADGVTTTPDDYGWGSFPQNLQGIVFDILPLLDPLVNFSNYDNDGDGYVDSLIVIHAGAGAEITGSPNDIWSSAWNMTSNQGPGPLITQDGVRLDSFLFGRIYLLARRPDHRRLLSRDRARLFWLARPVRPGCPRLQWGGQLEPDGLWQLERADWLGQQPELARCLVAPRDGLRDAPGIG